MAASLVVEASMRVCWSMPAVRKSPNARCTTSAGALPDHRFTARAKRRVQAMESRQHPLLQFAAYQPVPITLPVFPCTDLEPGLEP